MTDASIYLYLAGWTGCLVGLHFGFALQVREKCWENKQEEPEQPEFQTQQKQKPQTGKGRGLPGETRGRRDRQTLRPHYETGSNGRQSVSISHLAGLASLLPLSFSLLARSAICLPQTHIYVMPTEGLAGP